MGMCRSDIQLRWGHSTGRLGCGRCRFQSLKLNVSSRDRSAEIPWCGSLSKRRLVYLLKTVDAGANRYSTNVDLLQLEEPQCASHVICHEYPISFTCQDRLRLNKNIGIIVHNENRVLVSINGCRFHDK